ncbi:hypothetical protein DPMN_142476 [Dreissena polymorpha]|uniref:Uncharacterized protein n=1 Tax=Dreissena polymorpha TaxID=45954 RepID=A0A9D4GBD5_DREPO|nr:hypothetical protein DPMN_142476 [Dreissena polymorpha]
MRSGFQKRKTCAPEQSGWEDSVHGHNGRPQEDTLHGQTFATTNHYDSIPTEIRI